jgi:hypothetical protein
MEEPDGCTSVQSPLPAAGPETTDVVDFYYVIAFVHTYYARSPWHHAFNAQRFDVRLERCGTAHRR